MARRDARQGWKTGSALLGTLLALLLSGASASAAGPDIRVLFLGDQGHHQPSLRFRILEPVLAARGIRMDYTEDPRDLQREKLAAYDGLLIYANVDEIRPDQEAALIEFVEQGKGLIPLHCASFCFRNSPKYVALVGAQFLRHGSGTFRTQVIAPDHPVMKGYQAFESWDETYVHHQHNPEQRTVLEVRDEGGRQEPWTWVRTQGQGRVFYTAWGHDERTWSHPGFQDLVERGIRWATGHAPAPAARRSDIPQMTEVPADAPKFTYVPAKVPFYPASEKWGTLGEPIQQMQQPLSPPASRAHYVHPVGFELQLFAADPDIAKPICMNWDERGRLWICETLDYPNELQAAGQGRDRIRICEDTDGDGRADKFTVFADKLSIPTSLAFAYGGVVVLQAPDTLFLADRDGDDVADERHVLFTGWVTRDTHAGPSNLQFGPDNWFYGMVGYSGFEGEVAGQPHSFRTGFFRFRLAPPAGSPKGSPPQVAELEFLRNTSNNSWGVGFSEEGLLFGSTANGMPSVHLPIPNRYYEGVRGWSASVLGMIAESNQFHPITDKVRQVDHHGGFTAAAGHALYTARSYPREYWNRTAFVTEPTGHLVATFVLRPDGASFKSRNSWNLVASDDEWASPIMAEVGPDGQVWVCDWYNYIVQHNPTPTGYKTGKGNAYETELRDKSHGRIYRLVWGGQDPPAPAGRFEPLAADNAPKLVARLADDNLFWRRHAQRLLVERGQTDVVPALIDLARNEQLDEIGLNVGAMHALWTLQGLGALQDADSSAAAAAREALRHPSAGVRRAAVQTLPRLPQSVGDFAKAGVVTDPHLQVRLSALLALAEIPETQAAAELILEAWLQPETARDPWLTQAATAAAARHARYFLERVTEDPQVDAAVRNWRAQPAVLPQLQIVAEHYARSNPQDSLGALLGRLAAADEQLAASIIQGLARGWPRDASLSLSETHEAALGKLLKRLPPSARGPLVSLAGRWDSDVLKQNAAEIAASLFEQLQDEKLAEGERLTAAEQFVSLRSEETEVATELLELITPRTSPEFAQGLLRALRGCQAPDAGQQVAQRLASFTPAVRSAAVGLLLARADWTPQLLDQLDSGALQLSDLTLDQKQALSSHPQKRLAARARRLLERGGGLPNPDRQKVLDELLPLAQRTGDPAAGKEVFKKQCAKCHTYFGEGARVGPDLTGMAVHPKVELLTHILDPSRSVEGNFRVYSVFTVDGRVLNGLLASETKTSIELIDTEAKTHALLREDIDELTASGKSLMPEGFEKQVSPEELVNLLEFLTQRGRYLPLPLDRIATAVSTRGMFYSENAEAERLIFSDWSPKTVDGVPFVLVDPQGTRSKNVVLLYGPNGQFPPEMPKSVSLPCNTPAKTIHLLSGISGWGFPYSEKGSVSLIVRLHYADGQTEDIRLKNGEHFADYIRRVDVPESRFAFALRNQQVRYLAVHPSRSDPIQLIEFVKGPDETAPVIMAVTIEFP